jgi:CheY-like chemotaxis protein
VAETAFDLVLMDVQMSGMDGLTAARRIRTLNLAAAAMPIIAMTANVLPEQIRMFREAGMDDHIGKPFNRAALYQMVDKWLSSGSGAVPPADRAAVESDLLDRGVYDEIVALIGAPRTTGLLQALAEELDTRFLHEAETEADRNGLRFEAHSCVSSAGTLGFTALSDACRALEGCDEQRIAQAGLETFHRLLGEARMLARRSAACAAALAAWGRPRAISPAPPPRTAVG